MSKWIEGKIEIKCSMDVLKKALCKIHPEWEQHIKCHKDPMVMKRYNGAVMDAEQGGGPRMANVIIPGGDRGPVTRKVDNDWGFAKQEDGTWKSIFADFNLQSAKNLELQLKTEVAKHKALALASMNGYQVTYVSSNEDEEVINIKVDLKNAFKH